jgi:hypothetical protein
VAQAPIRVQVAGASDEEVAAWLTPRLGPHSWFVATDHMPELGAWVDIEAVPAHGAAPLLTGRGRVGWRYLKDTAPPGREPGFGVWVRWGPDVDPRWRAALDDAPSPAYAPPGSRLSLAAPPIVRAPAVPAAAALPEADAGGEPPTSPSPNDVDAVPAATEDDVAEGAARSDEARDELPHLADDEDEDDDAFEDQTAEMATAFGSDFDAPPPTVSTADERVPALDDGTLPTEEAEPELGPSGHRRLPAPLPGPDPLATLVEPIVGRSWLVRPTPDGAELRQRHAFDWPRSGTKRTPTPFEEYEEPEAALPDALPLPPELSLDETADAFNDEVTDPDRLSAFVHAAVDDTANIDAVVTDPEGAGALEALDEAHLATQEDIEPLKVNDDNSSSEAAAEPTDGPRIPALPTVPPSSVQAPSATADVSEEGLVVFSDEGDALHAPDGALDDDATEDGDDDDEGGFLEETADDLPQEGLRPVAATAAPVATASPTHVADDEEDPALEHEQPAGDRPRLEEAVWVALPGEPPQELFAGGAPLPAAKRREVGSGGDRYVEIGTFVQRGGQRELLGIARFETGEEGVVFPIELMVEPGWLRISADLEGVEPQRFRLSSDRSSSRPSRPAPGPAAAQGSGLFGRLKRFLGN